jgi:hypothetical protein
MKAVGASLLGSMEGVASIPGSWWRQPCRHAEDQGSSDPRSDHVTVVWWGPAHHVRFRLGQNELNRRSYVTFPPIWFSLCSWMFFPFDLYEEFVTPMEMLSPFHCWYILYNNICTLESQFSLCHILNLVSNIMYLINLYMNMRII